MSEVDKWGRERNVRSLATTIPSLDSRWADKSSKGPTVLTEDNVAVITSLTTVTVVVAITEQLEGLRLNVI